MLQTVVVLPFPFSDLSRNKYRPALVLADAGRGDWIACQITSNPYSDPRALALRAKVAGTSPMRRNVALMGSMYLRRVSMDPLNIRPRIPLPGP